MKAFLLSVLVVFITGFALKAKEAALKHGVSKLAKLLGWLVAVGVLATAVKPYLSAWHDSQGFWPVVFLLWLALLALMIVWVPLQAGEEREGTP